MSLPTPKRVCPLLERATRTEQLPYAPAPWVLSRCTESGFVFLENPPAYGSFEEDYAWEATSARESQRRQEREPVLYALSGQLKRFRGRVLKRNKVRDLSCEVLERCRSSQLNMPDIGCGWGGMLMEVIAALPPQARARCVPHGVEISRELAHRSNERLRASGGGCIHDNALHGLAQFPLDHFEWIIMSSFLEHEINPLPLLRRCHERLRACGHIVVKVPNWACINRSVRGERWCGFRWPYHVNYFTPDTLREMAARAGLVVSRMSRIDVSPLSDNMYAVLMKPKVGSN